MAPLLGLSRAIDAVTAFVGRWIYWLILAAILVSAGNAIIRKAFDISSNAWLELQWYLFGAAFLLAASYTLQRNEHIRIDIVSNTLSQAGAQLDRHLRPRLHAAAVLRADDLLSWPFFGAERIALGRDVRQRRRADHLAGRGSAILVGFVLLFLQGISELIKRIAVMRGDHPRSPAGQPRPSPCRMPIE